MELVYKLKQHTPMIHFQHDQKGATLRATEVKPKLDKFLAEKKIHKIEKCFTAKGSLPYKLQVIAHGIGTVEAIERDSKDRSGQVRRDRNGMPKKTQFPAFFGNVGDNVKEKKFVFFNEVQLKFFSFSTDVIEAIKQNLAEFLLKTNFGSRQSKGFGSFYIDSSDELYVKPSELLRGIPAFTINVGNRNFYEAYKYLFAKIDLFYRTLRSGINDKESQGSFYFKSLLFLYAKEKKNWTWDKKALKSKFLDSNCLAKQLKNSSEYLVRDLLGVATSQKYGSKKDCPGFILKHSDSNDIKRYRSPITFKPLKVGPQTFNVYLLINPVNEGIFNKEFNIIKSDNNTRLDEITLRTPLSFDIHDFIYFAVNVDLAQHVNSEYHKHGDFKKIKEIYSELREGIKNAKSR